MNIDKILLNEKEKKQLWFKAEMTNRQFASLANKLNNADIENEILNLDFFKYNLKSSKNLNIEEIEKWLKNSWNTENVLIQNKTIIENTGQSFSMQWAFPQAYYSTFGSLLALYKTTGQTQESHTAVLKHFSTLIEQNKFPQSISFYCSGGKNNFSYFNIEKSNELNTMDYDVTDTETIDNQICQFLKATREIKLDDRAQVLKFKNKKGQITKRLNKIMWKQVSDSVGHTTILDLLYRKRIKANYLDIDTFSAINFNGKEVLNNLSSIVNRLNMINEVYISKAIGIKNFENMLNRHIKNVNNKIVEDRFENIKIIINNQ